MNIYILPWLSQILLAEILQHAVDIYDTITIHKQSSNKSKVLQTLQKN